jgi:uncharacterized protein involved in exopolysaccharide biosynthesis
MSPESSTSTPFRQPAGPVHDTRLVDPRVRATVSAAPAGAAAGAPAFGVDDVYYALFRHKWKIIICALIGFSAAGGFYLLKKPTYVSSAKLFIRYVVMEGKMARPGADDTITKSPDRGGETIMSSEQEIISSLDLARKVAEAVGPAKILAAAGGGEELGAASVMISKGMTVVAPKFSSVFTLVFQHPDAEIAQSVLKETITQYTKMHTEIHRSAGMVGDFLAQETDQLRSRLNQTEEDLRKARAKAGVVSVEDAKKAYATQIDNLRQQVFAAQVELAQRGAMLKQLAPKAAQAPQATVPPVASLAPGAPAAPAPTAQGTAVPAANPTPNPVAAPASAAGVPETVAKEQPAATEVASAKEPEAEVPPAVIDDYRSGYSRVEVLRRREQELLLLYTPENSRVKDARAQLADAEKRMRELEAQHPALARAFAAKAAPVSGAAGAPAAGPQAFALELEAAQLNAIDIRVKTLMAQMDTLRKEAVALDQLEGNILELTRKRELEESNYRRYSASLEQSRINEALGSGKVSNISVIQTPTPPAIDPGKTIKIAGGIAAGGLGLGLAWAFLIEMLLDRSIRRPGEIERLLRIPLFLSIPKSSPPKRRGRLRRRKDDANPNGDSDKEAVVLLAAGSRTAPTSVHLNPYFETLRDRLIGYFESRNLTHKPKLVAMTGLGPDSGVTTMATGLARCLSETGDGNVLLVDLTPGQGSAQYFHHGKAGCGLEELLETRANAKVEERLFVASDGSRGEKLSRILPQRFAKLLPQLKSSDFDYIIFDMPPPQLRTQLGAPGTAGMMEEGLPCVAWAKQGGSWKRKKDKTAKRINSEARTRSRVGAQQQGGQNQPRKSILRPVGGAGSPSRPLSVGRVVTNKYTKYTKTLRHRSCPRNTRNTLNRVAATQVLAPPYSPFSFLFGYRSPVAFEKQPTKKDSKAA